MIRRLVPVALLLLCAACHRGNVADVTLDADAAAQNGTADKTLADLTAADKAASAPLPVRRAPAAATAPAAPAPPADDAASAAPPAPLNATDVAPE